MDYFGIIIYKNVHFKDREPKKTSKASSILPARILTFQNITLQHNADVTKLVLNTRSLDHSPHGLEITCDMSHK